MKPKLISLSAVATAAIAASSLCVTETVCAFSTLYQPRNLDIAGPGQGYTRDVTVAQVDTGIGTNPHLRSQSAGQTASSPGTRIDSLAIQSMAAGSSIFSTTER